nr:claudin-12 isoform X3 [Aotus nancymaae]
MGQICLINGVFSARDLRDWEFGSQTWAPQSMQLILCEGTREKATHQLWSMRAEMKIEYLHLRPQLGTCISDHSSFLWLCVCPRVAMKHNSPLGLEEQ